MMGIDALIKEKQANFCHICLDQLFAQSLCIINATLSGLTITTQKKL